MLREEQQKNPEEHLERALLRRANLLAWCCRPALLQEIPKSCCRCCPAPLRMLTQCFHYELPAGRVTVLTWGRVLEWIGGPQNILKPFRRGRYWSRTRGKFGTIRPHDRSLQRPGSGVSLCFCVCVSVSASFLWLCACARGCGRGCGCGCGCVCVCVSV